MSTDAPSIPQEVIDAAAKQVVQATIPDFIFSTKSRFDQTGLRIDEMILESGTFPADCPRFVANVMVSVPARLPPGMKLPEGVPHPTQKAPLQVPIPADDFAEAFRVAKPIIDKAAEKFQADAEAASKNKVAQDSIRKRLTAGL